MLQIAYPPDHVRNSWSAWDKALLRQCAGCKYKAQCGGLTFADDSRFCGDMDCTSECFVYCCFNARAVPMLDQLGGPDFDNIRWKPFEFDAPDFLWVLKDSVGWFYESHYIIPIDRLFDSTTGQWVNPKGSIRRKFEIPKRSKVGISFCAKDTLVLQLWDRRYETRDRLVEYGFDFVFPVNTSCYNNFPRPDTLINLKRRMITLDLFQEAGMNVIPDIGAIYPEDTKRWIRWINANKVQWVFCTWQTVKSGSDEQFEEKGTGWISDLLGAVDHDIRLYMAGVSARRVHVAQKALGNIGIVDSSSATFASIKKSMRHEYMRQTGMTSAEVWAYNREFLKSLYYGKRPPLTKQEMKECHGKIITEV